MKETLNTKKNKPKTYDQKLAVPPIFGLGTKGVRDLFWWVSLWASWPAVHPLYGGVPPHFLHLIYDVCGRFDLFSEVWWLCVLCIVVLPRPWSCGDGNVFNSLAHCEVSHHFAEQIIHESLWVPARSRVSCVVCTTCDYPVSINRAPSGALLHPNDFVIVLRVRANVSFPASHSYVFSSCVLVCGNLPSIVG